MSRFDELVAEGQAAPVEGWDFSWFAGRATEQRPSWGYARLLAGRMATAHAALDLQTGGGEVLAEVLTSSSTVPPVLAATESWPPNLPIARRNLAAFNTTVVAVDDTADLPFPPASFELVASRHPVVTRWDQVHRVLRPGGTYLSQQVGAGSVRELTDAMMGPQPVHPSRSPMVLAAAAEAAGLEVIDLRQEALRMEFFDIAAVIAFLRKVVWTVPASPWPPIVTDWPSCIPSSSATAPSWPTPSACWSRPKGRASRHRTVPAHPSTGAPATSRPIRMSPKVSCPSPGRRSRVCVEVGQVPRARGRTPPAGRDRASRFGAARTRRR